MAYRIDRFIPDSNGIKVETPNYLGISPNTKEPKITTTIVAEILNRTKPQPHWEKTRRIPVQVDTAKFAISVMKKILQYDTPMPNVGVASNGFLYIDWSELHYEIEIEFGNPSIINASRVHRDSNQEEEIVEDIPIGTLSKWVSKLSDKNDRQKHIELLNNNPQTQRKIHKLRNFQPLPEDHALAA